MSRTDRMAPAGGAPSVFLLMLLNGPLLAEMLRKYAIHSDMVFFVAEAVVAAVALICAIARPQLLGRLPAGFWVLMSCLVAWALIGEIQAGNPAPMFAIGLASVVAPLFHLVVSMRFSDASAKSVAYALYASASFWLLLSGVTAIVQLYLGQESAFTQMGIGELGIGDYTVGDRGIAGLFRPTSIFTHTGKFGQTIFVLVLLKLCLLSANAVPNTPLSRVLLLWDLGVVVVSGQRSAFLFLTIAVIVLFVRSNWRARVVAASLALVVALCTYFIADLYGGAQSGVGDLLRDRYYSAFTDIPERVYGNFIYPFGYLANRYVVFGEGFGYYSIGAVRYGSRLLYEYLGSEGGAESSWMRVLGEGGLVGLSLYAAMFVQLTLASHRTAATADSEARRGVATYFTFWLLSIMCWAHTHDVFGNVISMGLAFGLAGLAFSGVRQAAPVQRRHSVMP